MSLRPETIAIRNKPFVKRIMKLAKARKAKTLSGVVQDLCEIELARLDDDGSPHVKATQIQTEQPVSNPARV